MKRNIFRGLWYIPVMMFVVSLSACLGSGDETIVLEEGKPAHGIPSDDDADPNPEIGTSTTYIPNVNYTVENSGNDAIVRLDMTGVQNPDSYEWLKLVGTGGNGVNKQNVWVSVDGKPKGIAVYNNSDNEGENSIMADVVFLVDNSGSMSQEADAIAHDIVAWANTLVNSGLDVRFGSVGYSETGTVNGGLDITDVDVLDAYLDRYTGTSRTMGFAGSNQSILQSASSSYRCNSGECGVLALRFADERFSFRNGANRIYVNFTDEPNQPGGSSAWSVNYVNSQTQWNTSKGTIHTVYSDSYSYTESVLRSEYPWRLSEYTGGTKLFVSSDFSGVTLNSLPVTGAMQNSYIIRFTNVSEFMDGQSHEVKVTILSEDGRVRAEKIFYIVFGTV